MKYTTQMFNQNFNQNSFKGNSFSSMGLFSEQVSTVTNLFEGWNDCERTVVMYALLKRLRYPCLKFLHYSIDHTLTQNMGSQPHLSSVVIDINANNPSYLQNLLNAYKTLHLNEACDMLSSGSIDKDSIPCYGSDFQITHCDERKLNAKKEEILYEVLNMVPLLKPGNEDAKLRYLALMPAAVKDTMHQRVPHELVQQIFSYLLIHPAISTDDRRSLTVWLHQLEDHIHNININKTAEEKSLQGSYMLESNKEITSNSSTTSFSSSASCSSVSNNSVSSSGGNKVPYLVTQTSRNADWQTIAPPSKNLHQIQKHPPQPSNSVNSWSTIMAKENSFSNVPIINSGNNGSLNCRGSGGIGEKLCDNLNGITLTDLGSSQNSLGLSGISSIGGESNAEDASLVNGVAAAAGVSVSCSGAQTFFSSNNNPIISIINAGRESNGSGGSINSTITSTNSDEHDTSFSKNGTEILDFEPNGNSNGSEGGLISNGSNNSQTQNGDNFMQQKTLPLPFATILMANCEQMDMARWCLDGKLTSLKTRRSNSLTTQAISASSSSNSSVITVNDACSNSTENLAQFANKPRSFSLSIEHQRGGLTNSGSDTRLDEFKPNYAKFQTRNVGMSNIGLWLKSLRLHKYIDLFKNMTYDDMLQITEDYLQSLGVTKGASHKLALCIDKLKERVFHLGRIEQDLLGGQIKLQVAVEELANMVLTPMKPIETVNGNSGDDNVASRFLQVIDMVISLMQKDSGNQQDDESVNILMWILDRSIHNEIFISRAAQLKELKFKLSKLKMTIGHKMHHMKNNSGGNVKSRWNNKGRKCDGKNGSNDRINHRKNSNDMLNFSMNNMSQPQQPQQHHHSNHQPQQQNEYEKFNQVFNNNSASHHQYKSSSYPNFMNNQHQQQQPKQQPPHHHHQPQQHQHQQKMQQPIMQQLSHFPALPTQQQQQQHRRSLNNLIVVPGGPQQPQKMIFKPGQGIIPAAGSPGDNQSRRTSLTTNLTNQSNGNGSGGTHSNKLDISPTQQQQPKKSMASVVMVSNDDLVGNLVVQQQQQQQSHLLINNNNSNMMNNNIMCQQRQQHLQLLAAAAAAVGNSCRNSNMNAMSCMCNGASGLNPNSSNITGGISNGSCSNCCNTLTGAYIDGNVGMAIQSIMQPAPQTQTAVAAPTTVTAPAQQLITNMNLPINEKYQMMAPSPTVVAAAMNDIKSLEQLETLCLQMTEQAIN